MTQLMLAVFAGAFGLFNLYRGLSGGGTANYILAAIWFVICVCYGIAWWRNRRKGE